MSICKNIKEEIIPGIINILTFGHLGQPFEGHYVTDEKAEQTEEKAVAYEPSNDDIKLMADVMMQATKVLETVANTVRSDIIAGKYDEFIKKALTDTFNEELNNLCQK